jgi:hypothetical protein
MNLQNIAAKYVAVVNPWLLCTLQPSLPPTIQADGTQVPQYGPAQNIQCQVQALTYNDLMQTSGLNIQGRRVAIYINGDWEGVVRSEQKGGDLITTPDGSVWLCAMVLEPWALTAGWTKICATLQDGS